jgi:2-isopropylmalate synthase
VLDTTLRDGSQAYGVNFTLNGKLRIAERLDSLGIKYIEGGMPSSNPKDYSFFEACKSLNLKNSEIVPFSSTRRKDVKPKDDKMLNSLLEFDFKTVVIFGKSWDLHVKKVIKTSLDENLKMIYDTIDYLKKHGYEVIFDAEHFFDGYKENKDYALATINEAVAAGAKVTVLCDTNGGALTWEIGKIVEEVISSFKVSIGIHAHNDSGLAVANTLEAVKKGAMHVQGTINGLGERCGNADLCQVLPALIFKMGKSCLTSLKPLNKQLTDLKNISSYVSQLANIETLPNHPYVGKYAFSHKGGMHIDAIIKESKAYEHINPELVGNSRDLLISELSGKAAIIEAGKQIGINLTGKNDVVNDVLKKVKELESKGCQFENAKASVQIMIYDELTKEERPFEIMYWRITTERDGGISSECDVVVKVGSNLYKERASGSGPVHALDIALRKILRKHFPCLEKVELKNYKVSVVDSNVHGTASVVRVFVEFGDGDRVWATTYASQNIIEASAVAIADGYTYKLILDKIKATKGITKNV